MSILTNQQERRRFIRFAVVGVIGAVVDFGVFNLLTEIFYVEGLYAQGVSFSVAVASNFTWNRFWTYPDSRSKRIRRQLPEFFIVSLIGLVIRTPIFAFLDSSLSLLSTDFLKGIELGRDFLSSDFFVHNLALAGAVGIVMFWNFFVNRYWTYADVD